jgi:proprotein convertase subtilisin/kexin type 5
MTSCPINYTQNNISHQCVCPNSNYVDNSTYSCLPCSYVCRNCFGPSVDNCTVCSYPYYLLANSTKCRSACPSGQYADDTDRHCGLCDRICFTCTGSSSYCTGCSNGTYLVGSMCLNDCPDGY